MTCLKLRFLAWRRKCIVRRTVRFITNFCSRRGKKKPKKNPQTFEFQASHFLWFWLLPLVPQLHNSLAPQSIDNTNLFTVPHLPHISSSFLTHHHDHHNVYISIAPAPLWSHYTRVNIDPTTPSVLTLSLSKKTVSLWLCVLIIVVAS